MTLSNDAGRRERKRHQMLDHLAATAAGLFESLGYEAVTMERIASEADVAKRTLYNHFPTKEAVLAHWMHAKLEADLSHLGEQIARLKGFAARISCVLDASAKWCAQHPTYLAAYLRYRFLEIGATAGETGASGAQDDIAVAWRELIADGQRTGELGAHFSTSQLTAWFHHLYLGTLMRWLNVPGLDLRNELHAALALFLEGATHTGAAGANQPKQLNQPLRPKHRRAARR